MPSSACKKSARSEEHTSELQSHDNLVCRLLLEKKQEQGHRPREGAVGLRQERADARGAGDHCCCSCRLSGRVALVGDDDLFFFFFLIIRRPPNFTLFPYPTLFR